MRQGKNSKWVGRGELLKHPSPQSYKINVDVSRCIKDIIACVRKFSLIIVLYVVSLIVMLFGATSMFMCIRHTNNVNVLLKINLCL